MGSGTWILALLVLQSVFDGIYGLEQEVNRRTERISGEFCVQSLVFCSVDFGFC